MTALGKIVAVASVSFIAYKIYAAKKETTTQPGDFIPATNIKPSGFTPASIPVTPPSVRENRIGYIAEFYRANPSESSITPEQIALNLQPITDINLASFYNTITKIVEGKSFTLAERISYNRYIKQFGIA